jgi:hypothetical protein
MEIHTIYYYITKDSRLNDLEKDIIIDKQVRNMGSTFDPPPGLTPEEYSGLFMNQFLKNRNDARDHFNDFKMKIRVAETFQIGNQECIDRISQIEKSQDFDSWENPSYLNYLLELSKNV